MSWRTGSKLFIEMWPLIQDNILDRQERIGFTGQLLQVFVRGDMDTLEVEDVHPEIRAAMRCVGIDIAEPDKYKDDDDARAVGPMKPPPVKPQAEVAHAMFYDVPFLLAATKRRNYRESTLLVTEAVATVFTERGFTTSDWGVQFRAQPESFRVRIGDLSPAGYAFGPEFNAWLTKIGRWATSPTLEELRTSLTEHIDAWLCQ